jgi:hypothetical protein
MTNRVKKHQQDKMTSSRPRLKAEDIEEGLGDMVKKVGGYPRKLAALC